MGSPAARVGLGVATMGQSEVFRATANALFPKPPDYNAPNQQDPAVQRAVAEEARKRRMAKGYSSTILTSMIKPDANLKETLGE